MKENKLHHFEIFPWSSNFETGIKIIDDQHKHLVYLLNKVANSLTYEDSIDIDGILTQLAEYADYHFQTEENVWAEYLAQDKLFEKHQDSHQAFLPSVLKLKEEYSHQSDHELMETIVHFLIRWLSHHMIDEDLRLAMVIKELDNGFEISTAKENAAKKMYSSKKIFTDTIIHMYEGVSSRNLELMKERNARIKAQRELKKVNKKLAELSITDPLTTLYNRRHFETVFNNELQRAKRNQTQICLMIFDIDYFKLLNDTYGHIYGDEALIAIGKALRNTCKRPYDYAFRIGGEEFAVLTVCEHDEDIIQFSNLIKQSIDDLQIEHKSSKISNIMTISAGILSKVPQQDDSIDSFVKNVDKQLYKAKANGRNQIVYH